MVSNSVLGVKVVAKGCELYINSIARLIYLDSFGISNPDFFNKNLLYHSLHNLNNLRFNNYKILPLCVKSVKKGSNIFTNTKVPKGRLLGGKRSQKELVEYMIKIGGLDPKILKKAYIALYLKQNRLIHHRFFIDAMRIFGELCPVRPDHIHIPIRKVVPCDPSVKFLYQEMKLRAMESIKEFSILERMYSFLSTNKILLICFLGILIFIYKKIKEKRRKNLIRMRLRELYLENLEREKLERFLIKNK
jgi:hypothetical protein